VYYGDRVIPEDVEMPRKDIPYLTEYHLSKIEWDGKSGK